MTDELRDKARALGLDRLTDKHLEQFERATTGMERHLKRPPRGMPPAQEPAPRLSREEANAMSGDFASRSASAICQNFGSGPLSDVLGNPSGLSDLPVGSAAALRRLGTTAESFRLRRVKKLDGIGM
jgi:hypothetical protein